MKRFAYRACYQYNGPSLSDTLREEKSADEVTDALRKFPIDLEYLLPEGVIGARIAQSCEGTKTTS